MLSSHEHAKSRMMKKFLATAALAFLFFSRAVTAATPDLLSQIVVQLSESNVVRGSFVQEKRITQLSRAILSRGQMTVARNDGLIWRIESPLQMSIAFSGDLVIEIDSTGRRRVQDNRDNRVQAEVSRVFKSLLAADLDVLEQYFNLEASGDLQHWDIDLTPRSTELGKFIKTLELSGGRHIETIRVEEASGDTTLIRLLDVATANSLTADEQALLGAP